jgi:hypothetical protein
VHEVTKVGSLSRIAACGTSKSSTEVEGGGGGLEDEAMEQ